MSVANHHQPFSFELVGVYNYEAKNNKELSLKKGDKISFLQRHGDWVEGKLNGKQGWFPLHFVKIVDKDGTEREDTTSILPNSTDNAQDYYLNDITRKLRNADDKKDLKVRDKNHLEEKKKTQQPKNDESDASFFSRRPTLSDSRIRHFIVDHHQDEEEQKAATRKAERRQKHSSSFFTKFLVKRRLSGKVKKKKKRDDRRASICGLSLPELLQQDGVTGDIPLVVKFCVDFLRDNALDLEGIFRIPGHQTAMESLAEAFYKCETSLVGGITPLVDAHIVAELLKKVLRDMPEPLFSFDLHSEFIKAATLEDQHQRIEKTRTLFRQLPLLVRNTICYLFPLLIEVCQHSDKNLMGKENVSTIFAPSLMRSREVNFLDVLSDKGNEVVLLFLEHFDEIVENHRTQGAQPAAATSLDVVYIPEGSSKHKLEKTKRRKSLHQSRVGRKLSLTDSPKTERRDGHTHLSRKKWRNSDERSKSRSPEFGRKSVDSRTYPQGKKPSNEAPQPKTQKLDESTEQPKGSLQSPPNTYQSVKEKKESSRRTLKISVEGKPGQIRYPEKKSPKSVSVSSTSPVEGITASETHLESTDYVQNPDPPKENNIGVEESFKPRRQAKRLSASSPKSPRLGNESKASPKSRSLGKGSNSSSNSENIASTSVVEQDADNLTHAKETNSIFFEEGENNKSISLMLPLDGWKDKFNTSDEELETFELSSSCDVPIASPRPTIRLGGPLASTSIIPPNPDDIFMGSPIMLSTPTPRKEKEIEEVFLSSEHFISNNSFPDPEKSKDSATVSNTSL